jgi:pimeloyl-ACP methyl ester carboxylesterase
VTTVRDADLAAHDTGRGRPFFWGHGLTGSMEQDRRAPMLDWDRLAHRCRVVRWDARGHGRSSGRPEAADYRWDNLARDVIALADVLGVGQFVAAGVSMGAASALHAAVLAPDRVDALVLVLAPTAYETRAAQADKYHAGADLVEQGGTAAYVDRMKEEPVPEILSEFADLYHAAPNVSEPILPAVLRGAAASDLPPPDAVRAIRAPALLLAWETDPGHPLSTSERLAELLPDAELNVARRLRDVATWTDRVEAFLDRPPEGSGQPSSVTPNRST